MIGHSKKYQKMSVPTKKLIEESEIWGRPVESLFPSGDQSTPLSNPVLGTWLISAKTMLGFAEGSWTFCATSSTSERPEGRQKSLGMESSEMFRQKERKPMSFSD